MGMGVEVNTSTRLRCGYIVLTGSSDAPKIDAISSFEGISLTLSKIPQNIGETDDELG